MRGAIEQWTLYISTSTRLLPWGLQSDQSGILRSNQDFSGSNNKSQCLSSHKYFGSSAFPTLAHPSVYHTMASLTQRLRNPSGAKPVQPTYTLSNSSATNEPLPSPMVNVLLQSWEEHDWQHSAAALSDWLNARWAKTGYQVSEETVCFTLRSNGKDARMGLGDALGGAFLRD